ncbi:APC family permease [Saccharopolyspora rosea]|uniref:APC family permease n=1 Tax=Saccharopolyspora rosea TaxID=524884 RepID=A0ABW3FU26_9PSEU
MSGSPPREESTRDTGDGLKRDALGTSDLVFIVVSAAAPLMVVVGVAPLAVLVGGLGAPAAYLFAGVVLAVFAVGFTTFSRYVGNAGAFYSYICLGLGKTAGVAAALVALLSYNVLQIGVYGLLGKAAHDTFLDVFGIDAPWWCYAVAGVALVWYVGFRSVDFGAKLLAVLLVAETGVLFVLAVAILVRGGGPEGIGFASFAPSHLFEPGMASILPIAFAAFMGFEATVIYRSETRAPHRTIPRAMYIAVAVMAATYAFIVWSIVQAYGAQGVIAAAAQDPVGLFFTAAGNYVGTWFATVMHLLIVTSVVASLVAFHNAVTRYALVITREGLLPSRLAAVHPRTRSPHVAGLAQTVLALVIVVGFALVGADPYRHLLIWVNTPGVFGILLLQVAAAVSVITFFRRTPNTEGPWRTVIAPLVSALAMTGVLVLAARHVDLMTSASTTVNVVLLATIPLVCVVGLSWGAWLRRNRPEVYAGIAADCEKEIVR